MRFFLIILLSICGRLCFAQVDTTLPLYKRFPTLPPVQLLLGDSATKYKKDDIPKNKPVLLMLFSPDCSHCQHTAEELLQHKKDLEGLHIVMITLKPLWMMNEFVEKYKLKELENVVVGK